MHIRADLGRIGRSVVYWGNVMSAILRYIVHTIWATTIVVSDLKRSRNGSNFSWIRITTSSRHDSFYILQVLLQNLLSIFAGIAWFAIKISINIPKQYRLITHSPSYQTSNQIGRWLNKCSHTTSIWMKVTILTRYDMMDLPTVTIRSITQF